MSISMPRLNLRNAALRDIWQSRSEDMAGYIREKMQLRPCYYSLRPAAQTGTSAKEGKPAIVCMQRTEEQTP